MTEATEVVIYARTDQRQQATMVIDERIAVMTAAKMMGRISQNGRVLWWREL